MKHHRKADAMTDEARSMTREEFCARFKIEMLRAGPTFDDGASIAEYADEIGPTYWDDPDQRAEGPEACARADMSYWGED
jgi:hypothetical protein